MADITEEQYRKLKREVEQAKSDADRAQGSLDQLLARLKEEFNCKNLEEAKSLLRRLGKEAEDAKREFERHLHTYEEKWHHD